MNAWNDLEISREELQIKLRNLAADEQLIDVRESWELQRGILPGAMHCPLSRWKDFVDSFDPGKLYIIYCEHGVRSLDAALWMKQMGLQGISLSGGFAEWNGQIVPPESDPG